ncbi:MAG TPA: hypothetical protein VIX87_00630 [Steroidobacteraceae bacterium]
MPGSRPRASSALSGLARLYFQITIWRRGPQDVPAVGILLPLTIGAYVLLSAALGELLPPMRPSWWQELALDVPFMLLWYGGLLALDGRRERYLQTVTALFGVEAVLALPSMACEFLQQHYASDATWQLPVSIAALALLIWTLIAVGHILRATLERGLGFCLILAFVQMLAEEMLLIAVFRGGS